jgi:uncharacterized protein YdhG (YjbR/CyaY superfamily)
MAKTAYTSIDGYIAAQPDGVRPVLEQVRAAIRKALSKAEEGISYQIPVFKIDGRAVIYFAGWKKHYSVYPISKALIEAFGERLAAYEVNGKGTMRLPLSEPVPTGLIGSIAKFLAKDAARPN